MQGQSAFLTLLNAQMDATAKMQDALDAQRRVNGMLEEAARRTRVEKRQARGR